MAFAVEFYFDRDSDSNVRSVWSELSAAGLPAWPLRMGARPHVSVLVFDSGPLGHIESVFRSLMAAAPFHLTFRTAGQFGGNATEMQILQFCRWFRFQKIVIPSDGGSQSFDLLFQGVEITTGGQRLHRRDDLERSLRERGMDPNDFAGHLRMFDLGMPPHGGLAIGLERLTVQVLGLRNIRQAALYPRDRYRLTP